jgi:hypothetical protein
MSKCIRFQEMIAQGKAERAAVELLAELVRDPEYLGAIYNLGLAFEEMDRRELAEETFRLYLRLEPKGHWASHASAKLVESGGDNREE